MDQLFIWVSSTATTTDLTSFMLQKLGLALLVIALLWCVHLVTQQSMQVKRKK